MYDRYNEFGAIPSQKKNNYRLKNKRRSTSQANGYESGRFSDMSDIPTRQNESRFVEPRGSYGVSDLMALRDKKPV